MPHAKRPSPLPNRVDPFGGIAARPERGALMGNRGGRVHGEDFTLRRRFASRRWISCRLSFRDRRREVMGAGYTEFFFLDEPTALAAGHRPCFECRRADARAFAEAWGRAHGLDAPPRADAMDAVLHAQRRAPPDPVDARDLPDGAIFAVGDAAFLMERGAARRWSFAGYGPPVAPPAQALALTPGAVRAVLASGWRPGPRGPDLAPERRPRPCPPASGSA